MRMLGALVMIAAIVVVLPVGGQAMRGEQINVCASDVVSWLDSRLATPQLRCKEWHDQREVDRKAALDRLAGEIFHEFRYPNRPAP
jgi:hypothetical protein